MNTKTISEKVQANVRVTSVSEKQQCRPRMLRDFLGDRYEYYGAQGYTGVLYLLIKAI